MKHFLLGCCLLLAASWLFGQAGGILNGARSIPIPNDGTTGTQLNQLAIIDPAGQAILATTSNTNVQVYIVTGGNGTSLNAALGVSGIAPCLMDSTIASGAGGYYVIASVTTGGYCHAQSAAPASGTGIVGYLVAASTVSGAIANVQIDTSIFGGSSGLWNALLTPTGNLSLSTLLTTTTFISGDFGASPIAAPGGVWNWSTTSISSTDTSYEVSINPPSTSYHNPFYIGVDGLAQFQVCNIGGAYHLGVNVAGSAITCPNLSTSPKSKMWILSAGSGVPLTLYSTASTFTMLRMHNVGTGTGFDFFTACPGASSVDGSCADGNIVASLRGDGLLTAAAGNFNGPITVNGSTSGSMILSLGVSGGTLGFGSNASVDASGNFIGKSFQGIGAPLIYGGKPGSNFSPIASNSALAVQSDGNWYASNNGGTFYQLLTSNSGISSLTSDVTTSGFGASAATVVGFNGVPKCASFSPTNGQLYTYTTGGSPNPCIAATTGSGGSVSNFSAGNLSPLFTSSVATASTTPALTFSLSNATAGTLFGNATGSAAGPTFTSTPVLGVSGTAGTVSFFPVSGNFKTTLGSVATASNTVNFFASVPANLDLFYCAVSSTTCTFTDTGYPYNAIPFADLTGVASSGANSNITSLTGLTTPLSIAQGGSGTATGAAQNSVFAGPASGGAAAPSFQTAPTISAANMTSFPTFNQNTTGQAGSLVGLTGGNPVTATNPFDLATSPFENDVPNASAGTSTGSMVKLINTSGTQQVTKTATTDTTGFGCVQSGAGTSGTAHVAWGGQAQCLFDNVAITANDYVIVSANVAGTLSDAGTTQPSGNTNFGHVVGSHASCGSPPCGPYAVMLLTPDTISSGSAATGTQPIKVTSGVVSASIPTSISGTTVVPDLGVVSSVSPSYDLVADAGCDPTGTTAADTCIANAISYFSGKNGGTLTGCGTFSLAMTSNPGILVNAPISIISSCGNSGGVDYGTAERGGLVLQTNTSTDNIAIANPTTAPTITTGSGGSLAAATYWVEYTCVNGSASGAGETLPSPAASIAVGASGVINLTVVPYVSGCFAYNLYLGSGASQPSNSNMWLLNVGTTYFANNDAPPFLLGNSGGAASMPTIKASTTSTSNPPTSNSSTHGGVIMQLGAVTGTANYAMQLKGVYFRDQSGHLGAGLVNANTTHSQLIDLGFENFSAVGTCPSEGCGQAAYDLGGIGHVEMGRFVNYTEIFSPYFNGNYLSMLAIGADTVIYGGNVTQPCGIAATGIDYAGGSLRMFGTHFNASGGAGCGSYIVARGNNNNSHNGGNLSFKAETVQSLSAAVVNVSFMHGLTIHCEQCQLEAPTASATNAAVRLDSNSTGNTFFITQLPTNKIIPFANAAGTTSYTDSSHQNVIIASLDGIYGPQIQTDAPAQTAGNIALSAGWAATGSSSVTAVTGSQTTQFTITTGTTTSATPTVTVTLPVPMNQSVLPVCTLQQVGGNAATALTFAQTTQSATAPVFTANGTPSNSGATYIVAMRCGP